MSRSRSRSLGPVVAALLLGLLAPRLRAQQQFQGLCALVKMEIRQELAIERIGFLATLKITNNIGDGDITDFSAYLTFENPENSTEDETDDASDLFFVQPPELSGIDAIDGSGVIPATKTAVIQWFIIPKIAAGGTSPVGIEYEVGAKLAGRIFGNEIDPELLTVYEDTIVVLPEPQLTITYFQPRDVQGDDPFTQAKETPIPFTLGVLVQNSGYGLARNVRIVSQQPKIVENREKLLLIARLLGARVDDEPTDETSLTLELGDIEPGRCRKGAWDMVTSLSGEFTEFRASYTHASELGGRDTSVITSIDAHFISHEVLVDLPGRDELRDFLADTDRDLIPDAIWETDCNVLPVNRLLDVEVESLGAQTLLHANADREDWVFLRVDDPAQATLPLARVRRSDGKVLNPNNYWTSIRYEKGSNRKLAYLNVLDFVQLGDIDYVVEYGAGCGGDDTVPPVTTIRFTDPYEEVDGRFYITGDTEIFYTALDSCPTHVYARVDGGDFVEPHDTRPIKTPGEHTIEFYSSDSAGNEEEVKTAIVILSGEPPGVQSFELAAAEIFHAGDTLSVRPTETEIRFQGIVTAGQLDADIEIFRGIIAYPTLAGVPSSPTPVSTATLVVGGEIVDFYRFKLGADDYGEERPVSEPIELSGLGGDVQLSVIGRSRHGDYREEDAVVVSWVVSALAPPPRITGMPETPTRRTAAQLEVVNVPDIRYSLDGFETYQEQEASLPISLSGLDGDVRVDVIGKLGPLEEDWQDESTPTTVRWRVDRDYGFDFSSLERIRHVELDAIGDDPASFSWDGTDDDGVLVSAGWYTVRLTVRDALGRRTRALGLVRVESLLPEAAPISDAGPASQRKHHVAQGWVVWQDQRQGDWDIYARNLLDPLDEGHVLHRTELNQENPQTDGEYCVWEERRSDGGRDIWARKLGSPDPAFALQPAPDLDVANPAVDWPWVIYQAKPLNDPDHPWQLVAHDLRDGTAIPVDPTTQDQLDPATERGRVVWQDLRDAGSGEIYFKDLDTGEVRRLTDDLHGQFHPAIHRQWIVWDDNRNTQTEIYGYNLLRGVEIRLTNTPENETHPFIDGKFVTCEEDSSGSALDTNVRLLDLVSLAAVQLTNRDSPKKNPAFTSGRLVWEEELAGGGARILETSLPALQAAFSNRNAIAVTRPMADYLVDAYTLLQLWNMEAGVQSITRYTSLTPVPESETASWIEGAPTGTNFSLRAGDFVWAKFASGQVLDLGLADCAAVDLSAGINVVSYVCFPDHYSAYDLIDELGAGALRALRRLDPESGEWLVASTGPGGVVGENFEIPRTSVLILEMNTEVQQWEPGP